MNTVLLHKLIHLIVLFIIISTGLQAQGPDPSTEKNYVLEHTIREQGIDSMSQLVNKSVSKVNRSIEYMDGFRCFTWDMERFPDPRRMIAELQADGFKTVAIMDPGIKRRSHLQESTRGKYNAPPSIMKYVPVFYCSGENS